MNALGEIPRRVRMALVIRETLENLQDVQEYVDDVEIDGERGKHVLFLRDLQLMSATDNHLGVNYQVLYCGDGEK